MVNQKNSTHRFAFTMIELIFAIVVMSIAVMSLPVMTRITSEGIENSLVQEAIFAASAELMSVTSYYWDGNSLQDNATSHLSRVIDISNDCNASTNLRPGHVDQPFHRRCLNNNSTGPLDSGLGLGVDSIDSQEHVADIDIFTDTINDSTGYKDTYTSSVDVSRNGNIKVITSEIKNSDGDVITRLRTQSANVGEIDYYKRRL